MYVGTMINKGVLTILEQASELLSEIGAAPPCQTSGGGERRRIQTTDGMAYAKNKDFELHNRGQPLLQLHDIMVMTFQIHMVETIT